MQEIQINKEIIPIQIKSYSTAKTLKIYIKNGYILLTKPTRIANNKALAFLKEEQEKVVQAYQKAKILQKNISKAIQSGDMLYVRGKKLPIVIIEEKESINQVEEKEEQLYVYVKEKDNTLILSILKNWYQEQTQKLLDRRLPYFSEKIGVSYQSVKVKWVKTIWGSCVCAKKRLNFNAKLSMLPNDVADSVIVHELCHLKQANHGKAFWSLVYQYMPNYAECRKWLLKNKENLNWGDKVL